MPYRYLPVLSVGVGSDETDRDLPRL